MTAFVGLFALYYYAFMWFIMNNGNKVIRKENYEISNNFDDLIVKIPWITTFMGSLFILLWCNMCSNVHEKYFDRESNIEKINLKKECLLIRLLLFLILTIKLINLY